MKNQPIIKVENIGKQYRLGSVGTGTLSHDINRWWKNLRGKEDPYLKVGQVNDRTKTGGSDYVWALKDINFEVQPGEILGIIGKNGAGKSTLLKLLSRVTAPTIGKITCHGRIASLLEVGTGFHPELTGKENIYLNGAILGMSKKEIAAKFDEIVDFSGCAKYIETPVKRYSSGMYVRLAFAVAAHLEPDILVVDEVLAVGDADFQKKAIGKMKSVSREEGRTVLFVSHSMGAIRNLCTTAIVLLNGEVCFSGSVDDSIEYYMNNSKNNLKIPLKERKDRVTTDLIKFINIEILSNGVETSEIFGSSDLEINFVINSKIEANIIVEIQITNSQNQIVTIFNNYHTSTTLSAQVGVNNYRLLIPCIGLTKGNYYINMICVSEGIWHDSIEAAASFQVNIGDFYKTNKQPDDKQILLKKHSWL